jgi:hypothetical protein
MPDFYFILESVKYEKNEIVVVYLVLLDGRPWNGIIGEEIKNKLLPTDNFLFYLYKQNTKISS